MKLFRLTYYLFFMPWTVVKSYPVRLGMLLLSAKIQQQTKTYRKFFTFS